MKRGDSGFSLLELMIALVIVASVLAAASTFFISTVRQYKVQTKITESNVEGVIGRELSRQDIERLGFGLPWNNLSAYTESSDPNIAALNETPNAPRAVAGIDCAAFTANNSHHLVIRCARGGRSPGRRRSQGRAASCRPKRSRRTSSTGSAAHPRSGPSTGRITSSPTTPPILRPGPAHRIPGGS